MHIASELFQAADTLQHRAAAIRAVQGIEMNPFSRALAALAQVAAEIGAPLAIVGGLAGIHHQALITTLDIDVVVPHDQLDAFLDACHQHGMIVKRRSAEGWHLLEFPDPDGPVKIEVIPEGGRTPRDPPHAPPVPNPQELGVTAGLGYASFAGWAAMKLVANRDKDRYHLIEALKHASQSQVAEVVQRLRTLSPVYLAEFQRLLQAAEDENASNG